MMENHFNAVFRSLKRQYPEKAASDKETPWESLLFTMLSARSKDERTEEVFQNVMRRYPGPQELALAKPSEVMPLIKTIGLYRNKARLAVELAKAIANEHDGQVPEDMESLVALPGVGRKTASCVLVYSFRQPAIAVDTHVHRIANRLGWVRTASPDRTEVVLRDILPKRYWLDINRLFVLFGRDLCQPARPKCWRCPVRTYCAFPNKTSPSAK
jgi:endonuclease III